VTTATYTQDDFEALKVNDLVAIAGTQFGLRFPARFKKSDLVAALLQAVEGEDLSLYRIPNWTAPTADQTTPSGLPTDPEANRVEPEPMTKEAIAARVAANRQQTDDDEAERLRKAAEKSKPKKARFDASPEELQARGSKIGYAVGVLGWALNRIAKEQVVFDQVCEALGEALDADTVALAREGVIAGYAKGWDQFKFPSKACSGMDGAAQVDGIWAEVEEWLGTPVPALSIFGLLSREWPEEVEDEDVPEEPEIDVDEDNEEGGED
jgi:hypothetical protein